MSTTTISMPCPAEVYRQRRMRLAASLKRPLLATAGYARGRQYATNMYPFRAGSNYLYFGGPSIEGAALLIEPGSNGDDGCTLLRPAVGVDDAVWFGEKPSDDQLAQAAGLAKARVVNLDQLNVLNAGRKSAYVAPPCPPTIEWCRSAGFEPANTVEQFAIIDMRLIKDEHEQRAMRRAAEVTVEGHKAAMRACVPGRRESDVHAALLAAFAARECATSFTPIITVHGEVLHTETYPNELKAGQLLLVDAGAEEPFGYASDATRTFPVNGTLTGIQRALHETVDRARAAAVAACVPQKRYRDIHDLAARIICEGLVDAGLLRGDSNTLADRRAHTLFFTHGVGHLIGLDVHDMEDFGDLAGYEQGRSRRTPFGDKFLRLDRDLKPGFAVTIEPGIYLVPAIWRHEAMTKPFADVVNREKVDSLLESRFGGIRIEDCVLVRDASASGPEVLTAGLPTNAEKVGKA